MFTIAGGIILAVLFLALLPALLKLLGWALVGILILLGLGVLVAIVYNGGLIAALALAAIGVALWWFHDELNPLQKRRQKRAALAAGQPWPPRPPTPLENLRRFNQEWQAARQAADRE